MVNIPQTTYIAHQSRDRLVCVFCQHCGNNFFYLLTRVGEGTASSVCGIRTVATAQQSMREARADLEQRLASEAELVPCPKCNWINTELIEGYRLMRYRRLGGWALVVAFAGIAISIFLAVIFLESGNSLSFVIGGTVMSFGLAGGLYGLRQWLRGRIQPNRDFPNEPELPLGTPPALVWNDATQELRPMTRVAVRRSQFVDFQIGRSKLPEICSECLIPCVGGARQQLATDSFPIDFPLCASCARNAKRRSMTNVFLSAVFGLLIGTAAGAAMLMLQGEKMESFSLELIASLGFGVWLIIVVAAKIAYRLLRSRTAIARIVEKDNARSVVRLSFRSPEYAQIVAKFCNESFELEPRFKQQLSSTST